MVAYPGVPEPALEEPEPEPEEPLVPPVPPEELVVVVVAGVAGATGDGDGAGAGFGFGDQLFGFHGDGAENVVRAKKPMVTKAVVADPKERMIGNGL